MPYAAGVPRDPEQIQREIESSRTELAATLDQLAVKVSPKRLADEAKGSTLAFFQTPVGLAIAGGIGLLVVLAVARRVRAD
jgi:hypothetical protein